MNNPAAISNKQISSLSGLTPALGPPLNPSKGLKSLPSTRDQERHQLHMPAGTFLFISIITEKPSSSTFAHTVILFYLSRRHGTTVATGSAKTHMYMEYGYPVLFTNTQNHMKIVYCIKIHFNTKLKKNLE